jgi:hypothetical protein
MIETGFEEVRPDFDENFAKRGAVGRRDLRVASRFLDSPVRYTSCMRVATRFRESR